MIVNRFFLLAPMIDEGIPGDFEKKSRKREAALPVPTYRIPGFHENFRG